MNSKNMLWIAVAVVMLFGAGAAYSKSDKTLNKEKKPEKTCVQKCGGRYNKDLKR